MHLLYRPFDEWETQHEIFVQGVAQLLLTIMQTLKLKISEDLAKKLAARAKERGLSSEAFVQMVTEEVLNRSTEDFSKAVDHVLSTNSELYQRLAN